MHATSVNEGAVMKKVLLLSTMGVLSSVTSMAGAEEVGRVISSTPVVQQVAVPRQVCNQQQLVQQPSTGGGAVVGAIVGGLLGNTIGQGMGRAAATGVGVVAGAAVGDSIEGRRYPQAVQQCSTQTFYENRTVGYNVQYEYAGKQFSVQMPYDPGPTIRLQLSPVGGTSGPADMAAPSAPADAGMVVAPPVGQPIGQVVAVPSSVVYPVYYSGYYGTPYYYPPVGLSLSFGFSGGYRHYHHHWR